MNMHIHRPSDPMSAYNRECLCSSCEAERQRRDAGAAKAGCDILHIIAADERLKKLSDKELIIEVLGTRAADYRCVTALMDRLLPNWHTVITDEETQNAKPALETDAPLSGNAEWKKEWIKMREWLDCQI